MSNRSSAADRVGASASFGAVNRATSGRGQLVDALMGTAAEGPPVELPLSAISHNPDNPREDVGDVSDLAASFLEIGQVQAITVATVEAWLKDRSGRESELADGAQYVVVDGHRRLAGAHEAQLATIKVTLNDDFASTDTAMLEAAYIANAQREPLNEIDDAHALQKLVAFYGSQHQAAKRLGMTQANISQKLSLLALAPDLQADLTAGSVQVNQVRGLSKLDHEQQRTAVAQRIEAERRKKEQRKAAARPRQRTDNSVIAPPAEPPPAEHPPADSSVTAREPEVVAESPRATADNSVITSPPAPGGQATPPHEQTPRTGEDSGTLRLPWHNPQALNSLLREHMSAEDRHTLAKLLTQ
ncbi:ParB/RepB/Spo0J family partition protein [Streptomyces sp. NPDC088745]|uniref:ParB/RepB/Spo0J family partition protein n=1 Tax=Streptomyces sp. NPDC088745 TaxID=3365884 RepID=UPI003811CF60